MKRLSIALLAAALAGCGAAPTSTEVVAPNPNLHLEGIPPIPASLAREVEPYTQFRGHGFVDWHPQRREMLVAHRLADANTVQMFLLRSPMGALEPLTRGPEPVTEASFEPVDGRYIVFARSRGGDEADQLYRLDIDSRAETLLTDPSQRHESAGWLHRSARLLVLSVPLDRNAKDGRRPELRSTLSLLDPAKPDERRVVAELPGTGWYAGAVSHDDTRVALIRFISATESQAWLLSLEGGAPRQLLPAAGTPPAVHYPGAFTPDGRALYLASDRAGEFTELMRYDIERAQFTRISAHIPWDVGSFAASRDGTRLAAQVNVDGRDELRLIDTASLKEAALPALPAGSVGSARFHRRSAELGFDVNSAQGPSEIHSVDPATRRVERWTRAAAPVGVDPSRFADARIVRWTSFDGRTISGLMHRPPARFTGRRPVLVSIHGGPETQAKVGFLGRQNHYVQNLGIAVIQPNVRGSSGYGKTFLALDNGLRREDAVKDIGALLDWIATQPDLDPSRVLVSGGSYGGYMSLAVATHYAERIAGAIDVVGISSFVTFLESTESYRRDLRRVEYGDERDPATRAFLQRISPLNNAERITKPLFVVQGKNDPRVPVTEAEQIVAKARANGTPVWYLRAENEGHGFARKDNADFLFYATLRFMERTLLRR